MPYNLYPLASADGKYIPLDVLEPLQHKAISVTTSPMGAPVLATDQLEEVLISLYADADMVISFSPVVPIASVSAGELFLPARTHIQIKLPSTSISAISLSTAGTLHITSFKLWDSLTTDFNDEVR